MPAKNRQLKLTPTAEFLEFFEKFCEQWEFTEGEGLASLMGNEVRGLGFNEDIMKKRGTYKRPLKTN